MRFLAKLTYHRVWLPPTKRVKMHQTVSLVDWDDTMLPITYFQQGEGFDDLASLAQRHRASLVRLQR